MSFLGSPIAIIYFLLAFAIFLTVKARGFVQNIGLAAATVFAALLIAETAAPFFMPPRVVSITTRLDKGDGALAAHRPILGWGPSGAGRYRAQHFLAGKPIYDAVYTINADLLRKVDSGNTGRGIAFLGDSTTFGEGLPDSDTLPQQFADLEGRTSPVYNLGYLAYSPSQALAEMQAGLYDKQLMNSRLIVEFSAPWQAERVSCKATFVADAPRYVQINDHVVQQGKCITQATSLLSYLSIFRLLLSRTPVVSDSDVDIFVAVEKEVIRLAREKYKVPIVVYYWPTPNYLHRLRRWDNGKIMQSLREAGADVLEYEYPVGPAYRIEGDGHPTRLENAMCAAKLYDFVREKFSKVETTAAQ